MIRAEKNGADAGTGTENFLEQNTDTKNLIEKRKNRKPNGVFLYSLIYSSLYSYYGVQNPPPILNKQNFPECSNYAHILNKQESLGWSKDGHNLNKQEFFEYANFRTF